MENNKLTNNEEVVLRMLFSNLYTSKDLPTKLWTAKEKENLIYLGLISLQSNGLYILTDKGYSLIEQGGFVVKYPLSTEKGIVLNYNDTLNQFSPSAARALGLAIISTELYKRWGKQNNNMLSDILLETKAYYRNSVHPISRIEQYREDVVKSESNYERALNVEIRKIKDFELIKPLTLGFGSNNKRIQLIRVLNKSEGEFLIGNVADDAAPEVKSFNDADFYLSNSIKHNIVRQYHNARSNPKLV